jgi:indolepyruvate ferredoxin oxidoreductase
MRRVPPPWPHQTEHLFKAVMMPVLAPSGVQDYLDLGLHGWAMSRYSGCWVAFKAVADTIESSASVYVDPLCASTSIPRTLAGRAASTSAGRTTAWCRRSACCTTSSTPPSPTARANKLNRIVIDSPNPRLGIITCGKSYLDVRQAFDDLGIDDARSPPRSASASTRSAWYGRSRPKGVRHFAEGLEEILVVEEKRQLLEYQLKEELYNWREDVRPRVIGKFDEKGRMGARPPHGDWLLPACRRADAGHDRPRHRRAHRPLLSPPIASRRAWPSSKPRSRRWRNRTSIAIAAHPALLLGLPAQHLDQWCPKAAARWPASAATTWRPGWTATPHLHAHGRRRRRLGRPGAVHRHPHVFANLGDGTYFHSGSARHPRRPSRPSEHHLQDPLQRRRGHDRRPAGGRQDLTVPMIAHQIAAKGVKHHRRRHRRHRRNTPTGRRCRRRAVNAIATSSTVQRELREVPGVSALIYDQTCAAEKRRRTQARQAFPIPQKRVFINEAWCAKAAATAGRSPTAWPMRRWKPSSGASAASTSPPATRTTAA